VQCHSTVKYDQKGLGQYMHPAYDLEADK